MMKAIYGFNDKENSIECIVFEMFYMGDELIYRAECDGGIIQAPAEMFKLI